MNVTITKQELQNQEVQITPEFCFAQAAQALLGGYRDVNMTPSGPTSAAEWRLLGEALAKNA